MTHPQTLVSVLLVAAFGAAGGASAQLRLPASLSASQFAVNAGNGGVPGFVAAEDASWQSRGSWMAATWRPFGEGLRTSLGLISTDRGFHGSFYNPERLAPESDLMRGSSPYLGLGWSGSILNDTRLQLSAEFGAVMLGTGDCAGGVSCLRMPFTQRSSDGSGLRLNPYVTFGASYRY